MKKALYKNLKKYNTLQLKYISVQLNYYFRGTESISYWK